MTKITIPRNPASAIRIPAKPEHAAQPEPIERIGVSAKRAADMLDVSERTMWTLAKQGKVRTARIGKRVLFSVQSLRDLFNEAKTADTDDTACVAVKED